MKHDIDLIGYLEGSLRGEALKVVKKHLDACPKCQEELEFLKKSEAFFSKIYNVKPAFFCPETDAFLEVLMDESSNVEKEHILEHVKVCAPCQKKMAMLRESAKEKFELPGNTAIRPLPPLFKTMLESKRASLKDRLKQALFALKDKGEERANGLLGEVENLADELLRSLPEDQPCYALEEDTTLPSQTELTLRTPKKLETIEFQWDGYAVKISRQTTGSRIKLMKANRPARGVVINVLSENNTQHSVTTDHRGEADLCP